MITCVYDECVCVGCICKVRGAGRVGRLVFVIGDRSRRGDVASTFANTVMNVDVYDCVCLCIYIGMYVTVCVLSLGARQSNEHTHTPGAMWWWKRRREASPRCLSVKSEVREWVGGMRSVVGGVLLVVRCQISIAHP